MGLLDTSDLSSVQAVFPFFASLLPIWHGDLWKASTLTLDAHLLLTEQAVQAVLVGLSRSNVRALRLQLIVPLSAETISLFCLSPQLVHLDLSLTDTDILPLVQRQTIIYCLPHIQSICTLTSIPDTCHRLRYPEYSSWAEEAEEQWQRWITTLARRAQHLAEPQWPHYLNCTNNRTDWTEAWEDDVKLAIQSEDVVWLRWLLAHLDQGANTDLPQHGSPLLIHACDHDAVDSGLLLLRYGAMLENHTRKYTALFVAAEEGALRMVPLLLQLGSNIVGEFDFNDETAISIAAFKFCGTVSHLLTKHETVRAAARSSIGGADLVNAILEHRPYDQWRTFGTQKVQLSFRLAEQAVRLVLLLERCTTQPLTSLPVCDRVGLQRRLVCYVFLHEKEAIASFPSEHVGMLLTPQALFALLSEHSTGVEHQIHPWPPCEPASPLSAVSLAAHLDRLNLELCTLKGSAVSWTSYPRLFTAQYRGIHYFGNHFVSDAVRYDHMHTGHLNRVAPAPAVYSMSSLTVCQQQLARESVVAGNAAKLVDLFEDLSEEEEERTQCCMSSNYGKYLESITADSDKPVFQQLHSLKALGYPHYATSDLPWHALRYASGLKNIKGLREHRLPLCWDEEGKPNHSVLGKVYAALFQPHQLEKHRVVHVSTSRVGSRLSRYVRPERETSITGAVRNGQVFYEGQFCVPDFSQPHSAETERAFGLSLRQFERFSASLIGSSKAEAGRTWKMTEKLLEHLCHHQQTKLLQLTQQVARQRGGYLVYCHRQGEYGLEPPPLLAKIYTRERKLMDSIGRQRFD